MKQYLLLLCLLFNSAIYAQIEDTNYVYSHSNTHWNWNGNFYDTTNFPTDPTKTYREIRMHYVLGCPVGGCSGWDYTTKIYLVDSVDANTNVNYELTRIITPYAGDKSNGWFHEYIIDVTDFAPLLKGKKVINARYDGWQDGFTVSIYFDFIEGTPPRDVINIQSIYNGYYDYGNVADPIENYLTPTTVDIDPNTKYASFKSTVSGHGFGDGGTAGANPENCAEFCSKFFQVLVDNSVKHTNTVWKDDCGSEALFPQTGTWIYNRAGWCPGGEATIFDNDISSSINPGGQNSIDILWQSYTNTATNSGYNVASMLFEYGAANFTNDVEVYDILNPTDYDRYSRKNPGCSEPTIVIRNSGSAVLNTCKIIYYVEGGDSYYINWIGNLEFMETAEVSLPIPPENFFKGSSNTFVAQVISPNNQTDENPNNDIMRANFESPVIQVSKFDLKIRSNNRPTENWYIVYNSYGDTIVFNDTMAASTEYTHNLDLDPGCYSLYIADSQGDGLYYWADQNQGSGRIQLNNLSVNSSDPKFLLNLETEFGSFIQYDFTVGYDLTDGNDNYSDSTWSPPNGGNDISVVNSVEFNNASSKSFNIYPNPAEDELVVAIKGYFGEYDITVVNQLGATVLRDKINEDGGSFRSYDLSSLSSGIYFVTMQNEETRLTEKLIVK